jgi:hypothetical protein
MTWRSDSTRLSALLVVGLAVHWLPPVEAAPLDLWTEAVVQKVRDQTTLRPQIIARDGYFEVFYDSEIGDAAWADSATPYRVHEGDTIRIHGYLATPLFGGPYPGIVIGHGHGGHGSPELAMLLAAFGYVALSIDGPRAGQSIGGPEDSEQAWVSVEKSTNVPSPEVGYLYHYAYAGMRGLTLLERLSNIQFPYRNPLRIDRDRLGVMGASMGGQFTYYINGVDSRVKAAVAIAVAGDWQKTAFYEGAWLYHGLHYYTRMREWRESYLSNPDIDLLNTVTDLCLDPALETFDPTFKTFLDHFDPISYAPIQHAPLLTIIGTHDQYFTLPAINTTYDRVASAGTHPRFRKNILLSPNGKHGVLREGDDYGTLLRVIFDVNAWLRHGFYAWTTPPDTPTVAMTVEGDQMVFRATATPGSAPILGVELWYATQIDTLPDPANDFASIHMHRDGSGYVARLAIDTLPPSGPPATPSNILYFARVTDASAFTVTSKMYRKFEEMKFCDDFVPLIEHFQRDTLLVPPPPSPNCSCPVAGTSATP